MDPLIPFLAFKHVRRRPLQSLLTVVGVAVGVTVLITALSLTNGFIDELIDSTLQATPHVTLRAYQQGGTFEADPAVLTALRARDDVVAAAPYLSSQALIARRADRTRGLAGVEGFTQIAGIDPVAEQAVLDLPVLARAAPLLERGEGIVLGASLAAQLRVVPGDSVTILDIRGNRREFEVAGTFRVGNELIDALASYLSIPALQDYLDAPGRISGYHVRVSDPSRASEIAAELGRAFDLQPLSWERIFGNLITQLRLQKAVIGVVVFLIVLVAAMGIANILVLTVAEKTEDIAILRALGASERQVAGIFTLEGLLLGGAGTALGALLGLAVSTYFRVQPFPLPGDLYFITQLPVEVQAFDVAWVCGLSLATSVLAGWFPARRAAALDPVEVLR